MTEQVQCPNCGGYKVGIELRKTIFEENEVINQRRRRVTHMMLWIWGPASILAIISLFTGSGQLFYFFGGIITISLFIYMFWAMKYGIGRPIAEQYWYNCYLCGYKWTWRTDEPFPKISVRPDLIAIGEQKLEEERKRREEEYRHAGMWMNKK